MKENKCIITRKIEIIPIYSYDPETATQEEIHAEKKKVWDRIRLVDKTAFTIANRVATECWTTLSKGGNVKRGDLPKLEPYKIFSEKMCIEIPEIKELKISGIASGITKEVSDHIKNNYYNYLYGKETLPNYKSGYPMYIPRSKTPDESNGKYKSIGKLLDANNEKYIFNTPLGDFKLYFGKDRSNNKHIIDQCREGIYELCDSKIQYDKKRNKIYLLAVIRIPVDTSIDLDENKYIGADLGLAIPVCATLYDENNIIKYKDQNIIKEEIKIGSINEFLRTKTKFNSQRKSLQKELKYTKSGHGRKRKLIAIERLRKKEVNWTTTKNHKYSKDLIDFALKHNAKNIVFENLSGFNDSEKNQKFIGRFWSYFQLQTMVSNKAKKHNINVIFIDPRNTSKTCSICDVIDGDNRKSQSIYECGSCGNKMNADVNASRNIVKKHLNSLETSK